ncbi:hypothetical protein [Streptomyces sp. NPDC059991]|uniref:hypothetical protein n=1 Tax=unclassified Streptomyces TaxID=2593676 RepID=UPI0036B02108
MDDAGRVALMAAPWVPAPGVLVKDTQRGRLGEAVAWDADTRTVTLSPLKGGETWEAEVFRPPNELDRLRARIVRVSKR